MSARLKEQMLNIAEKNIDVLIPEWRLVAKTVLMYFNLSWNTLTIKWRSKVDVRELNRSTICTPVSKIYKTEGRLGIRHTPYFN